MSKTRKVLAALQNGQTLTAAQIRGTYKLANPWDPIMRLRHEGHCIYTTNRTLYTGQVVKSYAIGKPSREMVATAAHLFNHMFQA